MPSEEAHMAIVVSHARSVQKDMATSNTALKERVYSLEQKLTEEIKQRRILKDKVEHLLTKEKEQDDKLMLYDLICLFEYYFVTPRFGELGFSSWHDVTEEYAEAKADIEEGVHDAVSNLEKWANDINAKLPEDIDICELLDQSKKRHDVAYTNIRSTVKQESFITACSEHKFGLEQQLLVGKILSAFKGQKLRRKE